MRVFMSFFFIPFFHIPYGFLIIPWVVGVPIMAAGMYPMCFFFFLALFIVFIRPVFQTKWMSRDDLLQKLKEMRGKGPCQTNKPGDGGPLSIDPLQVKHLDDVLAKHRAAGHKWFMVQVLSHDVGVTWIGTRKQR